MSSENLKSRPVAVIGFTILFLILLSFLPDRFEIIGYETKPVDLFIDVIPDSLIGPPALPIEEEFDSYDENNQ